MTAIADTRPQGGDVKQAPLVSGGGAESNRTNGLMNNITILQQPRTLVSIPLITETPRLLNDRLWSLAAKEHDGTATADETRELDRLCKALESEQDL